MFNRRENVRFGQSYARQREELLRRATKGRVKKLLVIVRNGTLVNTGTGISKEHAFGRRSPTK